MLFREFGLVVREPAVGIPLEQPRLVEDRVDPVPEETALAQVCGGVLDAALLDAFLDRRQGEPELFESLAFGFEGGAGLQLVEQFDQSAQ